MDASRLSRRALLGATVTSTAAALLVSGCAVTDGSGADPTEAPVSSTDVDLAEAGWLRENDFRELCVRIRRRHPALADRLDDVIAGLRAHEEALAEAIPDGERTDISPVRQVPRQEPKAAALVAATADELHRRCLTDCVAADSGALARLLAAIAASHAVTAEEWRR